jgi:hypothetical protein
MTSKTNITLVMTTSNRIHTFLAELAFNHTPKAGVHNCGP